LTIINAAGLRLPDFCFRHSGAKCAEVLNPFDMEIAMKVRDAMHKGADWVETTTPVPTIAAKMRDLDVGAIPIGENDRLIGMVTDRDIALRVVAVGKDAAKLTARDVMMFRPSRLPCRRDKPARPPGMSLFLGQK
jgi:signal-transduction protein with cAMP-binding, CBS, and nucleotidyltransferase domain